MDANAVVDVLNRLPRAIGSASFNDRLTDKIESTAAAISPVLTAKHLRIVVGGTSPSQQRTYTRLYLEPEDNTTHDRRHSAYCVLHVWEFQTRSRYGFRPISGKRMSQLLDELVTEVYRAQPSFPSHEGP